jgi:glutamate N-acetyltransferase / amino-acid N-acetyltransferase
VSDNGKWTVVDGGVSAAQGFTSAGVEARIRYRDRPDLGIILCSERAAVAGVFTKNRFASPTIQHDREQIERSGGHARAVVVNAGNANAATGAKGLAAAKEMTDAVAAGLGIPADEALVSSTGVIGEHLPMDVVHAGIEAAVAAVNDDGNDDFSSCILTTDTVTKEVAVEITVNGEPVRIGGCSKGSGMIAPNMATMLGFVTTDAAVEPALLQQMLRRAVARSFNRVSVDGDESTNDTVFLMASGLSQPIESHTDATRLFEDALEHVCQDLAKKIARDGEGATRLIEVHVTGGRNEEDAERAARAVAESSLVKTAVYGEDANWGRIACALGYSGADFAQENVSIGVGDVTLVEGGARVEYSEEEATEQLKTDPVRIVANLGAGSGEATFWSCDLTEGYIEENASYRS